MYIVVLKRKKLHNCRDCYARKIIYFNDIHFTTLARHTAAD